MKEIVKTILLALGTAALVALLLLEVAQIVRMVGR